MQNLLRKLNLGSSCEKTKYKNDKHGRWKCQQTLNYQTMSLCRTQLDTIITHHCPRWGVQLWPNLMYQGNCWDIGLCRTYKTETSETKTLCSTWGCCFLFCVCVLHKPYWTLAHLSPCDNTRSIMVYEELWNMVNFQSFLGFLQQIHPYP